MSEFEEESIETKTLRGGKAYSLISICTQLVSWVFTFWVIRLLDPEDYGLMAMAGFIISFLHVFSNLGLGTGIIQKDSVTDSELSSIFWFSLCVGLGMSIITFFLAYPNAYLFENQDLIPITQAVAPIFFISSIGTVPQNFLSRNYKFKEIAIINMTAAFISSVAGVIFAYIGLGVYTLVLSSIILQLVKSLGYFYKSEWRPRLHFFLQEVNRFLRFGATLSLADATARLINAFDKLIIGKLYSAVQLGLYSTGIAVSNMPIDKLSPLIHPVILPMLSRWKNDLEKSYRAYLEILKYYLLLITPIYVGGAVVAHDLILVVLGEKWMGVVYIFQMLCFARWFKVLSSYHKVLVTSQGNAKQILFYDITMGICLVCAIYLGASFSLKHAVWAWVIVYPFITVCWLFLSLRERDMPFKEYLKTVFEGVLSSFVMLIFVLLFQVLIGPTLSGFDWPLFVQLCLQIFSAIFVYVAFVIIFQKNMAMKIFHLVK